MEENKRTDSGYTGEYGNPVEHNDAPQVETENAAAYSETAQSASEHNIEVGKSINCQVVVNHTIELTEEEKAEARKKAIERYQVEEYRKLTAKKPKAEKQVEQQIAQPSLFEF